MFLYTSKVVEQVDELANRIPRVPGHRLQVMLSAKDCDDFRNFILTPEAEAKILPEDLLVYIKCKEVPQGYALAYYKYHDKVLKAWKECKKNNLVEKWNCNGIWTVIFTRLDRYA